jgi:hypothetical protein
MYMQWRKVFYPEDGGTTLFKNVRNLPLPIQYPIPEDNKGKGKGKAVTLEAWTGPQ